MSRSSRPSRAGRVLAVTAACVSLLGSAGCSGFAIERVRFDPMRHVWVYDGRETWFDNDLQPDGLFAYNTLADMSIVLVETDHELYEVRRFTFDPSRVVQISAGLAVRVASVALRAAMASQGIPIGFDIPELNVAPSTTDTFAAARSRAERLVLTQGELRGALKRAAGLAAGIEAALGGGNATGGLNPFEIAAVASHAETLDAVIAELSSRVVARGR